MATIKDVLSFIGVASGADPAHGWIGSERAGLGLDAIVGTPVRKAKEWGCGGVYIDSLGGKDTDKAGRPVFAFSRLYSLQATAWVRDALRVLPAAFSGWDALKLAYLGNPWGDQYLAWQTGMRGVMVVEWTFDFLSACGFNAVALDAFATTSLCPSPSDKTGIPYGLGTMQALAGQYGLRLYSEGPPARASNWLHHLPVVCGTQQFRPMSEGRLPELMPLTELPPNSILLENGPAVHSALDPKPVADRLAGLVDVAAANGVLAAAGLEAIRDPVRELRLEDEGVAPAPKDPGA